jgi:hypothetical protein
VTRPGIVAISFGIAIQVSRLSEAVVVTEPGAGCQAPSVRRLFPGDQYNRAERGKVL